MIYLDNAATTKTSPAAQKAMLECMEQFWGIPSSLHTPGQKAAEALAQAALSDKKRAGDTITVVVPRQIGVCELRKLPVSQLQSLIAAGLEV